MKKIISTFSSFLDTYADFVDATVFHQYANRVRREANDWRKIGGLKPKPYPKVPNWASTKKRRKH